MANVNGNWKGGKSLKKIPGQGVRTHDVMKGISFKDKAYKWGASTRAGAQKGWAFTKAGAQKGAGKIARSYRRYGKPTETLFRRVGATALGAGKLALRFPGTGLALTGLYYGGKAIGTRAGAKKFKYPGYREFNKKGRKII